MKQILFSLLLFVSPALGAQTPDTTVYDYAESMPYPLLAACSPNKHPGWTEDSVRRCAEQQLLALMARYVQYPAQAREKNTEGTVVTSFVVETDGRMSRYSLLRDIGDGCGEEALRVLRALDTAGLRWQPGMLNGKPVRTRQTLPLRFKLQEALPYYIAESGDTLYSVVDTPAAFKGGLDTLNKFIVNRLEYPTVYLDSCKTGIVEMALIIDSRGRVRVENQIDFNNLGYDFQWNALRLANRTAGLWTPAMYQGRPVATSYPLRVLYKSPKAACKVANERFDRAMLLADEAVELVETNQQEAAIAKLGEALQLHPDNTELLYYRGTAYLNLNRREEACADYNRVKTLLGVTWFEGVRRLVCGW